MTALAVRKLALGLWPTPLYRLWRLERALGTGPLLVKRDDLSGFAYAGNKTRALEYLLGDAVAGHCDVLVAGGRPDSNFCPAAAAAAAAAGLRCELVMAGADLDRPSATMELARAFGAELHCVQARGREIDERIAAHAAALARDGAVPYQVPRGGSTGIGALGFADAALELHQQLVDTDVRPQAVVCAVGSGGTYAGLLAGATALGWTWPVVGASVSRPLAEITAKVRELALQVSVRRGTPVPPDVAVDIVDSVGAGHGHLTDDQRRLADVARKAEGLMLDDTYTAKAFELAVEHARRGNGPVVFWHTGGSVNAISAITGGHLDG